jgi:ectoine hydroxylase-related dioxygenase (phytanoyl-CoA dioxygenase family)
MLTEIQLAQFHENGYYVAKSLFDEEETDLLRHAARHDPAISGKAKDRDDGSGGKSRITLWNEADDSVLSMYSRSERIVSAVEQILGGEVYHWHSKMMQKEPFVGGAWVWHQDYGYWYNDTCLFPLLLSCYIAVDKATKANGCLQVLKGSHLLGRIEHMKVGDQTGADPVRCIEAEKVMETVYCEMDPGDALFFHCNLLHKSEQNTSPDPRWALICCYNARRNSPFGKSGHPPYSPLERVPDALIKETGLKYLGADLEFLE